MIRGANINNIFTQAQFKDWVVKKIGTPLLQESDWNYAGFPNSKFSVFVDGTGAISRDTSNFFYGGLGSAKMLTDAVANHNAEVKTSIMGYDVKPGELLAFELKFAPTPGNNSLTQFQFGIEARSHTTILHSRFRWSKGLGKWQIEKADTTYQDFSAISPNLVPGIATTDTPQADPVNGSIPQWARSVIDPIKQIFISFETIVQTGGFSNYVVYDLRKSNIGVDYPLVAEGAATQSILLFFALINNGTGAAADSMYTTDWCISKIPANVAPF